MGYNRQLFTIIKVFFHKRVKQVLRDLKFKFCVCNLYGMQGKLSRGYYITLSVGTIGGPCPVLF